LKHFPEFELLFTKSFIYFTSVKSRFEPDLYMRVSERHPQWIFDGLCLCAYPPPHPKVKHDLIFNDLQVYKLTIVAKLYTSMKFLWSVHWGVGIRVHKQKMQ